MRINYVIATWSGNRINSYSKYDYYQTVLKNHIAHLNTVKCNFDQITIMKPYNPVKNSYYDIPVNGKIKIIDCENKYQSYGQWFKATQMFMNDFDYFIYIEDDYIPGMDDFDLKLIDLYKEGTYLCSKISSKSWGDFFHCEVSNGILSRKTIENLLTTVDYNKWFDDFGRKNPHYIYSNTNYQVPFSRYMFENGIALVDYRDYYEVDFYTHDEIRNYSLPNVINNEKVFIPIQMKF